ncbi:SDR family oxidoreductase [Williamsia maris]|uniref:Thioester reductase domain-containing protein n=1 Tax=Williamsia maris TaxID=72806 RepID=A0ABT1H9P1_9NOCA|nr:SDR family oxidoreductase [Williamsia maris]MCP2174973.1 Thioester reductase domain-containing protein [Williamsia maris]
MGKLSSEESLRPLWPHADAIMSSECRGLRFNGKYADVVALSTGDPTALRPAVDPDTRRRVALMPEARRDTALILGANGFLGAHLIGQLTRDPSITRVYAMIRPTADRTAEQRLQETLDAYEISANSSKITFVEGNPTERHFGLSKDVFFDLAENVGLIFNCASSTDYTSTYLDLRSDWFLSLLRALEFSITTTRKHLTYVGSIGAHLYQRPEDFRRHDGWWYSGYAQMKWVNAALLGWLADSDTYSVTLCEAPYILGSTQRGLDPGRAYSFWRIVEVAKAVGAIWDGPGMNYVPVDVICEVMAHNATSTDPLSRLLPSNPEDYDHSLYAELLGLDLVSWDEFYVRVSEMAGEKFAQTVLGDNIDILMRKVHKPEAILPAGHDASWCDHRRLFELYFSNVALKDMAPAVASA